MDLETRKSSVGNGEAEWMRWRRRAESWSVKEPLVGGIRCTVVRILVTGFSVVVVSCEGDDGGC